MANLTKGQQLLMTISDNVPVIAAKDWKVAGKSVPKVDERRFYFRQTYLCFGYEVAGHAVWQSVAAAFLWGKTY